MNSFWGTLIHDDSNPRGDDFGVFLRRLLEREEHQVRLGDVSVGQQLIDLKLALDRNALSQDEYVETKKTLLSLNALCENTTEDDE
jgi:hypothetical protein